MLKFLTWPSLSVAAPTPRIFQPFMQRLRPKTPTYWHNTLLNCTSAKVSGVCVQLTCNHDRRRMLFAARFAFFVHRAHVTCLFMRGKAIGGRNNIFVEASYHRRVAKSLLAFAKGTYRSNCTGVRANINFLSPTLASCCSSQQAPQAQRLTPPRLRTATKKGRGGGRGVADDETQAELSVLAASDKEHHIRISTYGEGTCVSTRCPYIAQR